jgi:hypothetical protein
MLAMSIFAISLLPGVGRMCGERGGKTDREGQVCVEIEQGVCIEREFARERAKRNVSVERERERERERKREREGSILRV